MALDIRSQPELFTASSTRASSHAGIWPTVRRVLMPLASLKLTIVLFALSIFLVFAGTLAQKEIDVWEVIDGWFRVDERLLFNTEAPYFHPSELFVRIPLQYFCIDLLWPAFLGEPPKTDWAIWFPRGWLLGLLMGINLVAAHTVRFTVQTRGTRLWAGVGVILLGCLATYAAVESGSSEEGVLGPALVGWDTVWKLLLVMTAGAGFLAGSYAWTAPPQRKIERVAAGVAAVVCLAAVGFGLYYQRTVGTSFLNPESMRILWQLLKGLGAGAILLVGCRMVFKKRAGIVLLHGGIALIFLHEVIVGVAHQEGHMTIVQGESSNWTQDIRAPELAFVLPGDADDKVTKIPKRLLVEGQLIQHSDLPYDVKIVKSYVNTRLRRKGPFEPTPATAGIGTSTAVVEVDPVTGTSSGGGVNQPSLFVELLDKQNGKSVGTYLVSVMWPDAQQLPPVGDKTYGLTLRFEREYKPYTLTAEEVRADHYVASSRPKNYSSTVHVVDPTRNVDREERIWMNNPMRFAGETFYQTNYFEDENGTPVTTLQVVENAGWMLPYMACMIVGVGMLAQFGAVLARFLARRQQSIVEDDGEEAIAARPGMQSAKHKGKPRSFEADRAAHSAAAGETSTSRRWVLPVVAAAVVASFFAYTLKPPKPDDRGMNLAEFAKLPVAADARVKPYDALARSTLVFLSQKQTFKFDPADKNERSKPAIRWLLDVMTGKPEAENYKVFRIENDDVVRTLGLKHEEGMCYSWKQLFEKKRPAAQDDERELTELEYQFQLAAEKAKRKESTTFERELDDLERRVGTYRLLTFAFTDPEKLLSFDAEKLFNDPEALERKVSGNSIRLLEMLSDTARMKESEQKPAMAVHLRDGQWETLFEAGLRRFIQEPKHKLEVELYKSGIDLLMERVTEMAKSGQIDEEVMARLRRAATAALKFNELYETRGKAAASGPGEQKLYALFDAYRAGSTEQFNSAVADYRTYVEQSPPAEYDRTRRDLEAFMLRTEPFFWCSYVFLVAGLVAVAAWLAFPQALNRTALWITLTAFVYYTFALVLRMYVTERPPVVNLYSSAVFIGWSTVLMGLLVERVYRNGIGVIVAAISGYGSLQIAHLLSRQGDTIENLQAVLDTQFWLTTHVVCITLGYAATFFAGLLGLIYVIRGVATPNLDQTTAKDVTRKIYGTLCFALLLSFIGTVLGGLWADDSWGRFWGWDPKENGALIIVLWNALVLHARWDGIVKDRGLAVLAVAGNITTSWSWFGVNQLGVGLHAYGFSKELRMFLSVFVMSSVVAIAVGLIPKQFWWSRDKLAKA